MQRLTLIAGYARNRCRLWLTLADNGAAPTLARSARVLAMEPAMKPIWYPYMRADLRAFSESLADEAYQKRVWVERQPSKAQDNFTDVVHFFYDDTKLASYPDKCVGWFLRNASEVAAVRALTSAIDALFAELGTEQPDEAYLREPGWSEVVSRAKELVTLLDRADGPAAAG